MGISLYPAQVEILKGIYPSIREEKGSMKEVGVGIGKSKFYWANCTQRYNNFMCTFWKEFLENGGTLEQLWEHPRVKEHLGIEDPAPIIKYIKPDMIKYIKQ